MTLAYDRVELVLRWAACTDRGLVRENNQDSYRVAQGVVAVCDGLGGHEGGEVASAIVADVIGSLGGREGLPSVADVVEVLGAANAAVVDEVSRRSAGQGMGTTVAGVALANNGGVATWVGFTIGDSRLYRFGRTGLQQISHDHTVAQELLDEGELLPEEVRGHRGRHVVTRVVGSLPPPIPDIWLLEPMEGDRFFLCSDGVHGELEPEELSGIVADFEPGRVIGQIIEATFRHGARDNLTAVVLDTEKVDGAHSDPADQTMPRQALRRALGGAR